MHNNAHGARSDPLTPIDTKGSLLMNAKNVWLTGALAALFAVSGSAVVAQDASPAPSTTDAVIVDGFGDPVPLSDYQLLSKVKNYNVVDIQQARLEGFSFGQVAMIAKIATMTG